jgi:hypothetical protein
METTMDSRLNALAPLNAAPARELTHAEVEHRNRLLGAILNTIPDPAPKRSLRPGRIGLVAAGVFALVVTIVIVGQVRGAHGGALDRADIAGWTADPVRLLADTEQTSKAAQWCDDELADAPGAGSATTITNADLRGEVASMVVTRGGSSLYCLASQNGTGLWETVSPVAPLPADGVSIDSAGVHGDGDDMFSYMEGSVGRDVTGVIVHDGGHVVDVLVDRGRWTAWWPGEDSGNNGAVTILLTGSRTRTVAESTLYH